MRGSSRLLISLSVLLGLLDRIVMQGSEKRIVGYICIMHASGILNPDLHMNNIDAANG